MTNMKRTTVSLPDDLAATIRSLKSSEEFRGRSYSEIIRRLVRIGLNWDSPSG
mgnify:CR=1 FL=1